jgi:hypothetical protein
VNPRGGSSDAKKTIACRAAVAALLLALPALAQAAWIYVDDSDLGSITISAGDFEYGFYVEGSLLTTGLGSSGSLTLPDAGYSISGSWIDLGATTGGTKSLFALPSDMTAVTSGIEMDTAWTDGFIGSFDGSFGGFFGSPYFITSDPTAVQDGHTEFFALPYLSGQID